jgi:hypothetical protein
MNNLIVSTVFCTLQVEGTHNWKDCPIEEVAYLRDPHRHMFHIKAYKNVSHDDRDTEFIVMKHKIQSYLTGKYFDPQTWLHQFGGMSCEMIARELIGEFDLAGCEVSEDGENGCWLQVVQSPYSL